MNHSVGSRVVLKAKSSPTGKDEPATVIMSYEDKSYLIECDNNIGGHNGWDAKVKGKDGHCWYVGNQDILILASKIR